MDKDIEMIRRKVDEVHSLLFRAGAVVANSLNSRRESELEQAIRKAIEDLEGTKSSFKSKQIMTIKEELSRAVERKS